MGTPKSVIVLLTLSLVVLSRAAAAPSQGDAAQTPQAELRQPSPARSASAIVKVTADADVIQLDCDSMFMLLQHSGIVRKAARGALGLDALENSDGWINIDWPSASTYRPEAPGVQPSSMPESRDPRYDAELLRQLEKIYGPTYVRQMVSQDSKAREKNSEVKLGAGRGTEQAVTFVLYVHLPEDVRPAAEEFLKAVVEHLRGTLLGAYYAYEDQIDRQIMDAQSWWEAGEDDYLTATGARSPAQLRVREQLDTMVDLSSLSPRMPLGEALEELQQSVEPPLQIAALWRDLLDNADIEPSTPINMGPLPQVKLGTALDVLLKAVGGEAELQYRITDDVITVGTAEALADRTHSISRPTIETDIGALDAERRQLSRQVRNLELELAGLRARQEAIDNQISIIRSQAQKRLAEDTVTRELEKLVEVSVKSLRQVELLLESGRTSEVEVARLREDLARANIELAQRREELSRSAGGGQIEQFNNELSRIEIDMAEKRAQLDVLRKQLEEIGQETASAATFDPQAARIRIAREAMDAAEQRITDLKRLLMSLQEPTVTIISSN